MSLSSLHLTNLQHVLEHVGRLRQGESFPIFSTLLHDIFDNFVVCQYHSSHLSSAHLLAFDRVKREKNFSVGTFSRPESVIEKRGE